MISTLILIIFLGYLMIYLIFNNKHEDGIIVLAYHHFLTAEEKNNNDPDNYFITTTEQFEEQMKYLIDNGYNSITPEQIKCYLDGSCNIPEKSFIVTIDDGNISSYYYALPILEKYEVNSINFVISSRVDNGFHEMDASKLQFLSSDELEDIYNNHLLMTIGSHSNQMHDMVNNENKVYSMSYEEILNDVSIAKKVLYDTDYFAYPFGGMTDDFKEAVKNADYDMAFLFDQGVKVRKGDNIFQLPRIEIRGDYSLYEFSKVIEENKTFIRYTKDIVKKIIGRK